MKYLLLTLLLILTGCSNGIPYEDLIEKNGLYYEVNSKTPFTGIALDYYNDRISARTNYIEGKADGTHEAFHSNGQLEQKGNHIDGQRAGIWEYYYDDGQLDKKVKYVDGVGHNL